MINVSTMSAYELRLKKNKAQEECAVRPRHRGERAHGLPYEIHINGSPMGRFDDLRDAASSAWIAKRAQPDANIVIVDAMTRRLIIEIIA